MLHGEKTLTKYFASNPALGPIQSLILWEFLGIFRAVKWLELEVNY
jgi:hypothetical protein